MEVNSIKKVLNLISKLNVEDCELNFKIRKIDYCYELTFKDYTICFEDIPYERNKYIEISNKLSNHYSIKLNYREIQYFRLIFKLLLTNYLRNLRLSDLYEINNL